MNKKNRLAMYSLSNLAKISMWWGEHQKNKEEEVISDKGEALLRELDELLSKNI